MDADLIVLGGGAAGFFGAIAAAQRAYQDAGGRSKETGGQADENSDATNRRAAADIAALEGVLAERGEAVSWELFTSTSVYRTLKDASTHHLWKDERPSYMSAKAFADAVWEMVGKLDDPGAVNLPGPLGDRVRALHAEAEAEALKI